jgi:hypothetical protein
MADVAVEQLNIETPVASEYQSLPSSPTRNSPMKACYYFGLGKCRNGSECRFSHDPNLIGTSKNSFQQNSPRRQNYQQQRQQQQYPAPPNFAYQHMAMVSPPPPPMFVQVPPEQPVYCIDVECVATGIHHNSRAVAQIAMVDQWNRVIYNEYIKQDIPVVSYLTELHGITKELIEEKGIILGKTNLLSNCYCVLVLTVLSLSSIITIS